MIPRNKKPRLSQHFLRDPHVVQSILAAAELSPESRVLEIGPGRGVMTEPLVPRVRQLVAVELDRTLAAALQERYALHPQVTIVQGDFLKADLDALFPNAASGDPVRIVGNLPYAITSPIFEKILPWPGWDSGVFLIQREVAERILAGPGSRIYGILSLAVQLFAEPEKVLRVKPGAFRPPPRVMSLVIRLRRKTTLPLPEEQVSSFFDLAHAAFAHRRKTLANSLALYAKIPRVNAAAWLAQQSIDGERRAETLALSEYVRLAVPWSIFRREINLT